MTYSKKSKKSVSERIGELFVGLTLILATGCVVSNVYEISVETPIEPKMDIRPFQRVLVAGFVAGGTEDVDTNLETVRLLRSQLRSGSSLQVIDADVLPLIEIAKEQALDPDSGGTSVLADQQPIADAVETTEDDLEEYERIFANVSFWKSLGEEHQEPLIVTGTIFFTPHTRSGLVTRQREIYDAFGRRRVTPVRTYRDRSGFILSPKFIFIDGRSGTTLYSERHREEILYDANRSTPILSSYFELMDRLLPTFLSALSSQKIRGTRVILK